jgi:hypothetical protein
VNANEKDSKNVYNESFVSVQVDLSILRESRRRLGEERPHRHFSLKINNISLYTPHPSAHKIPTGSKIRGAIIFEPCWARVRGQQTHTRRRA